MSENQFRRNGVGGGISRKRKTQARQMWYISDWTFEGNGGDLKNARRAKDR